VGVTARAPARLLTRRQRHRREALLAYLFLLPALVVLAAFHLFPAFYSFYMSLYKWEIIKERFVGLRNYVRLAGDAEFLRSLWLTVVYVVATVPVEMAIGLVLAVLLFQGLRARGFFRLLYFMPNITSLVAAGMVWGWIFNKDFGFANALMDAVHLPQLRWLLEPRGVLNLLGVGPSSSAPSLALFAIILVTIWFFVGFHTLIYLSGLTAIPAELLEAARMDGAGGWRLFRHITFPLLTPTTYFLLIVATIGAMTSFNLVYVMGGGGANGCGGEPLGTTRIAGIFVFDRFWCQTRLGYASAAAFFLMVVVVAITALNVRFVGRRVQYVD
jgi:ABC-type sugar transport system permease subunit